MGSLDHGTGKLLRLARDSTSSPDSTADTARKARRIVPQAPAYEGTPKLRSDRNPMGNRDGPLIHHPEALSWTLTGARAPPCHPAAQRAGQFRLRTDRDLRGCLPWTGSVVV